MSGDLDDFDALFEEISAQRAETVAPVAPAAAAVAPATPPTPAATAAPSPAANSSEDVSDKPMFERLGGIVRLLHDSLRELGYDRSLSDVASQITDAQGRLEYVATLTEQAANKVLNAIDIGMPEQDALSKTAKDINTRWGQLFDGKLNVEEFKTLANDSRQFSNKVVIVTEAEKARLLEIMMAQDFQDITGQLIKRIVTITHKAESELAQLLRDNAPPEIKAARAEAKPADTPVELLNGPSAPTIAMVQDDVDDLLADLGF
ncbi:protein phosphatase CheZ [Herminiimonas fonticola]|uniref:Protein phosphatase CheZ n=1 Tax=Herminiimonas fonticola TaxID=303380 RepID=A0A4R6G5P3_9BURK|nr:protein phosphatase CheZ [Herminiimonas fonticola]RBA23861.1 Chemotaxis protein [Herminiimonas fonticola]TDN89861.1 chemotaxis protein CheZ [Herminiimonas fonticola]